MMNTHLTGSLLGVLNNFHGLLVVCDLIVDFGFLAFRAWSVYRLLLGRGACTDCFSGVERVQTAASDGSHIYDVHMLFQLLKTKEKVSSFSCFSFFFVFPSFTVLS